MTLSLVVNGKNEQVDSADGRFTVADLIGRYDLVGRRVAVELNGRIVPAAEHAAAELHDGDRLEVVTLVGGG